ncbi:hypothetical protein C8Q74DRAFT_1220047 [Fomes fomentarius]|nr:hypothetical protein C8Q74DRAFT_1220047 [Fomes fomentarius]
MPDKCRTRFGGVRQTDGCYSRLYHEAFRPAGFPELLTRTPPFRPPFHRRDLTLWHQVYMPGHGAGAIVGAGDRKFGPPVADLRKEAVDFGRASSDGGTRLDHHEDGCDQQAISESVAYIQGRVNPPGASKGIRRAYAVGTAGRLSGKSLAFTGGRVVMLRDLNSDVEDSDQRQGHRAPWIHGPSPTAAKEGVETP